MPIPSRFKSKPKKLLKYLKEGGYKERAKAAYYLGELNDPSYLTELKKALKDPVPAVVDSVVEALEKIGIDNVTRAEIKVILKKLSTQEAKLKEKVSITWREKTEAEKQADLEWYAAHSHIRKAEKLAIKEDQRLIKNWLAAAIILGIAGILSYLFWLL